MPETAPPDIRIRIDGRDMPARMATDVISVRVEEDLGALSTFAIELYNWDEHTLKITWSDDRTLVPGAEVSLALGWVDQLTEVMTGEITSVEPAFLLGRPPRLTIRGFDHGHRLQRGQHTRSFMKMKDSDIAAQLAREHGLRAEVTESKVTLEHVTQQNQTDWAFLAERARRIGYVLRTEGRKLRFGPLNLSGGTKATLRLSQEVRTFEARLSNRLLADEQRITGWDLKQKRSVVARASSVSSLGGGPSGLRSGASAFGAAVTVDAATSPGSQAEAAAMAAGQLTVSSLDVITGDAVCEGQPKLHAGDLIRIAEAGTRFSGTYLVAGVAHTVDTSRGYRTRLAVRRNSI